MEQNNRMVAPCGMNCRICLGHLREKNVCHGCWGDNDNKPYHCVACAIKNCDYLEKTESKFCYDCEVFPCKRLKQLDKRYRTKYNMSMIENLENIKKLGLVQFEKNEHVRWLCKNCGGIICVHRKVCLACQKIEIRHARLSEKEKVYRWLCKSGTTSMHMGSPDYPESPVPDWNQFNEDFKNFYFLESGQKMGSVMIIEKNNEEIGCLCYACFHLRQGSAELDIWLKSKTNCGHGYGTTALKQLLEYLINEKGITNFIIRPSEKNLRAIKSYEKAGFKRVKDKTETIKRFLSEEYIDEYGDGDYGFDNTAVLTYERH